MRGPLCSSIGSLVLCLLFSAARPAAAAEKASSAGPSCDGTGPQAPRDIDKADGANPVRFSKAPPANEMNLCNIHFHKYAEHKAQAFSTPAGAGDHRGWACESPQRTDHGATGNADHGDGEGKDPHGCTGIAPGDTAEVHWVFTTCDVEPGEGLKSCLSDTCSNPQFRVETQVWILTEGNGHDFGDYARSAPEAREAVEYLGSTTGPKYDNESSCSPLQVTWRVRHDCRPLDIASLNAWCAHNDFKQDHHAQGVRKLVENPALLSRIP